MEKGELIDFSSEDDFLVDYPFRDSLQDLRLSVTFEDVSSQYGNKLFKSVNPLEAENIEKRVHQMEQKLSPSEPLEPRRASYLRKSLAWDNAFFTNAGVLDPEELSVMNKGFKKRESFLFPGIQEDLKMRRSADTESTFDSDEFSLESVEGDLFEDIRASIYRSYGSFTTTSCKSIHAKTDSKKVNANSENMMKSRAPSKRTIRGASLPPQTSQKNAAKGEYSKSPCMPPKILSRLNVVPGGQPKRVSSGYGRMENKTTMARHGQSVMVQPKQSGPEDSCDSTKFSTPPIKSSSSVSRPAGKISSVAGSSSDESATISSSKSSSSLTRSIGSTTTKIASSGSTSNVPLTFSSRCRSRLGKSTPTSIRLLSMSNNSSNKSPVSSMGEWSSGSSSSTSNTNQRSVDLEFEVRKGKIQGLGSYDQSMKKASRAVGSAPKCSGLRMPSPTIGFFDEKNSMVPTVSESLQFQIGAQNTLPALNANATKRRPAANSKNIPENRNKVGSQQPLALHATTSQKTSGMRNSLRPAMKVLNDTSLEVDTVYCSKTRKVGHGEHDRRKVGLTSSLSMEAKRTKGVVKNKMGIEAKGQKTENDNLVKAIDPQKKEHAAKQQHVGMKLHSISESKTKISSIEDQVNDLSRHFEIIDLGRDVVIELGRALEHHGEEPFLKGQQPDSLGILKPIPHSLPTTVEFKPNMRTPLAEKNCACNQSGSCELKKETAQEKLVDKL